MMRARSWAESAELAPYIDIGSPLSRTSKNATSEMAKSSGTASRKRRTISPIMTRLLGPPLVRVPHHPGDAAEVRRVHAVHPFVHRVDGGAVVHGDHRQVIVQGRLRLVQQLTPLRG